jgi:adenylate cyclase
MATGLLAVVCLLWVLLSQVEFLRLPGVAKFFGPDGMLSFLEEKTVDWRIALRGPLPGPVKLRYVDVDTRALQEIGNFPWNREVFAQTLDALFRHGKIHAAGLDFVFSDAGLPAMGRAEAEAGTMALGRTIREFGNVVLAATYSTENRLDGDSTSFPFVFEQQPGIPPPGPPELPAFPIVGPTWGIVGLIDTVGEGVRFVPLFAPSASHTYYTMALQLALLWWNTPVTNLEIGSNEAVIRDTEGEILARVPLRMGQLVEPNWFSSWMAEDAHNYSLVDILAAGEAAESDNPDLVAAAEEFFADFEGSIVLIGPVDPMLKDLSVMPLSGPGAVPRVSLHGNLLQTLVAGRALWRFSHTTNSVLIFLLGFAAALFCLVPARLAKAARFLPVIATPLYLAAAYLAFARADLVLPVVAPLGAALSCIFVGSLLQLAREQIQKRRIQGMFGAYLSPVLVERMVESGQDPELGGVDAEVSAFFSDLQGFSNFSEHLEPQKLVLLMNEYLTEMTDILFTTGCYVDKFIGDSIVGIFNAPIPLPDHALKACIASQKMHQRLAQLRVKWAAEGDRWPEQVAHMRMRIGINTGFATVGNMGSKKRFNYTMMGDTVNLAARCESGAKEFGVSTMVTGETMAAASAAGNDCVFRHLGTMTVKGRSQPAEMFEVVCLREELTPELEKYLALYEDGRKAIRDGNPSAARTALEQALKLESARPGFNPAVKINPTLRLLEKLEAEYNSLI